MDFLSFTSRFSQKVPKKLGAARFGVQAEAAAEGWRSPRREPGGDPALIRYTDAGSNR
jgi:hypothetical protein